MRSQPWQTHTAGSLKRQNNLHKPSLLLQGLPRVWWSISILFSLLHWKNKQRIEKMRYRQPVKQRSPKSDAVGDEPRWRVLFRCFGDRPQAHQHTLSDRRKRLEAQTLVPRRDTASLTSYEVSSSAPLLNHRTQPKRKSVLDYAPRSNHAPRNSIVTESATNVAYKQLNAFMNKRQAVGDDEHRDPDTTSTSTGFGFIVVKNDADHTTISGLTTPAELQSLSERLGANQARNPNEKQTIIAPVNRAKLPDERPKGSATAMPKASRTELSSPKPPPKSTANTMSLKSLNYYNDVARTDVGRCGRTQYSSPSRAFRQHGTTGHVCWV